MSAAWGIYQVSSTQSGAYTTTEYLYVSPDGNNRLDTVVCRPGPQNAPSSYRTRFVEPNEASRIIARQGVTLSSTIPDHPSRVWLLRTATSGASTTTVYIHKYPTGSFIAKTLVTPTPAPGQTGQPTETRRTLSGWEAYELLASNLPPADFADETF
jgi:hypothetical protein